MQAHRLLSCAIFPWEPTGQLCKTLIPVPSPCLPQISPPPRSRPNPNLIHARSALSPNWCARSTPPRNLHLPLCSPKSHKPPNCSSPKSSPSRKTLQTLHSCRPSIQSRSRRPRESRRPEPRARPGERSRTAACPGARPHAGEDAAAGPPRRECVQEPRRRVPWGGASRGEDAVDRAALHRECIQEPRRQP